METGLGIEIETVGARRVVSFPLHRRTGEVRRVARALAAIADVDDCDAYRHDLAEEMFASLASLGLSEDEQDEEVGAFFHAVECALEHVFAEALEQASIGLS